MLTDLPLELFRTILVEAVRVRGVTLGLRLRLVSKVFSVEVLPTVFESGVAYPMLQNNFHYSNYFKPWRLRWQDPHFLSFVSSFQSFAASRARFRCDRPDVGWILQTAETLCAQTGNSEATHLRKYIHSMCYSPKSLEMCFHLRSKGCNQRYLLQAAIINDQPDIISNILSSPDVPQGILARHSWDSIEDSPMVLAGMHGNRSIIRLLLSPLTAHLRERTELLEEAFYGAIHSGCIQTIQFILSPEFGRIGNFSGWLWEEVLWISTHYEEFLWGETPLSTGMANSASVDFCHQFYELLRSSPEPSIYNQFGDEPDLNEQLHRICTAGIQREDVTKYLLDKGATVQDTSDGTKNRVDIRGLTHERIRPERPWNPLRAAVKSGHEKIVRVLLDAGADPNKTDNDVLWVAAQSGRTDIVRLLLDHGAKVNMAPCPGGRYYTLTGWETPLLVAERSENEALCELLKSKMTAEENEAHRVGDRDSETYREWKTWIEYTYGSMEDLDETVVRNYVPKNYWDYGKII